ncbi:MAG: quinate 5-dehydrogenase [Syntrophomonas sp.]|uniref:quinate 5-dehydrogenase n=1 Tax=Syntrophomonas sp. TaxID=2053627 RepID=UPI00261D1DE9|nr:quinate 5-dehydrogenase [Syntrophomonas sp.]MDD2511191.1 quinate 5-dehydrogenase [Syntrophomonas sp.]MDD4627562.1 quinate 5-dehydrogenase [Syntrophomonas sp.]
MKRIVSVSLGASHRDHSFETEFMGVKFHIERIGTDGDWNRAINLIRELDGKVDAFGMGGIDLYVHIAGKRYVIKDARRLMNEARKTPMLDGSGLKNTLERKCIMDIQRDGIMDLKGKRVLMVCAVDRFGMAEAFEEIGARLTLGDFIYTVGVPIPMHSLRTLRILGSIAAPFIVTMPFDKLYPTGKQQDVIIPKHSKYYYQADVLAGDFLYIRRYLPEKLNGQVIITNTTTRDDMQMLKKRGISKVITTTPDMGGRSFGTNVIEAVMVTLMGRPIDNISPADYFSMLQELNLKPGVVNLEEFSA